MVEGKHSGKTEEKTETPASKRKRPLETFFGTSWASHSRDIDRDEGNGRGPDDAINRRS
jgi:hypothetical protein